MNIPWVLAQCFLAALLIGLAIGLAVFVAKLLRPDTIAQIAAGEIAAETHSSTRRPPCT